MDHADRLDYIEESWQSSVTVPVHELSPVLVVPAVGDVLTKIYLILTLSKSVL